MPCDDCSRAENCPPCINHQPGLITWGEKHSVPGEVCMGCSDPDKGVWVPVTECEAAMSFMTDDPGSMYADLYTVTRDGGAAE